MDLPEREILLSPWLQSQSLVMIHAWRGVGKTHVALGLSYALASGGEFLGWRAPSASPVLYVDGEMPVSALKDRVARIVAASDTEAAPGALRFLTPDLQPFGYMPNLSTSEGQEAIDAVIGDSKVIIVDNLSSLVRTGKENEAEGWQPIADWGLRMRASGRSVVFVHHSGKGGTQRGTSKREDLLDAVIALKRPLDYDASQGARFEVHFEKARALHGQEVNPVEAWLQTDPDGKQAWTLRDCETHRHKKMIELAQDGLSQADIARELGIHRSNVLRFLRKAKADGSYNPPKGKP
ncbi:MAG: AAA family ATPase [Rhodanobacter sp.]|jgi:hypothetical protein|nr:AAA family ATPase [Rhodanobacter sp.]